MNVKNIAVVLFSFILGGSVAFAGTLPAAPMAPLRTFHGWGSSSPNRPDVSLSPLVRVYEWNLGVPGEPDASFVQVNSLTGKVLGEFIVGTPRVITTTFPKSSPTQSSMTGSYQCPCSSKVVAIGPGRKIIAVTDRNDNVVHAYCVGAGCHEAQ